MTVALVSWFRLLAIDPGSNEAGFVIMDYNPLTKEKIIKAQYTYTAKMALKNKKSLVEDHGSKVIRFMGYMEFLNKVLDVWQPDVVICESPFLGGHAQAFRVLSELTILFQVLAIKDDMDRSFKFVTPPEVKKNIGVKGNSGDKEEMKKALLKRNDICLYEGISFEDFSEHTIDAACIGIWGAEHYWGAS